MEGTVSQLTSKSIQKLASEFTRANSICPDNSGPSQSYLQLLSRNENEDKRSQDANGILSGGGSGSGGSISSSTFSNISKSRMQPTLPNEEYSSRPYLIRDADKKKSKNLFDESGVFSKFGRLVGEQFGVFQSSKSLSDIKRSLSEAKDMLQKEIDITEFSRDHHARQIIVLSEESRQQRLQLYSWGELKYMCEKDDFCTFCHFFFKTLFVPFQK
jgi:hypothetical protein